MRPRERTRCQPPEGLIQTVTAAELLPETYLGRSLAEMDVGMPPVVTDVIRESLDRGVVGYLDLEHTRRLQAVVTEWFSERYGWEPAEEAIRPVPDLVTGFRAVLTHFLKPGEPIIVPTPGYMPFLALPPTIDRPVIEVPMVRRSARDGAGDGVGAGDGDAWHYDYDGIRAAFAAGAKMLVLCNPHNPIGKVATREELARIEAIVDEAGGIVFADEIHAPILFGDTRYVSYAATSPRAAAHTITATSASKAFNIPALKCGQLIFTNPEHLAHWRRVGHWVEHGTSILGVLATEAAYRQGRTWLADTVTQLQHRVREASEILRASMPRTGIRMIAPDATYLLWIDLSLTGLQHRDESPVCTLEQTARLRVTDGAECGATGQGFVRFNAALRQSHVQEAMHRLVRAAEPMR